MNFSYYFPWSPHEKKPAFLTNLSNRNKGNRENSEKIREIARKSPSERDRGVITFPFFQNEIILIKIDISIT
jgi:hypothetical protein